VGSGPRGKTIRHSTARELLDAGIVWETDFDNRGDRPEHETVSDVRIYMPTCDRCHVRFAANLLAMDDATGALLCRGCRPAVSTPVVQPASVPRGGARKGAGRKPRSPDGASTVRPGVPMTDAEWAAVVAYATERGITNTEAVRRLVARGLART